MNIKAKAMTALAAATLAATPAARAKTVAWYHFNEGASGETAAGGQPVVLNAVDPDSLAGTPYELTGTRTTSTIRAAPAQSSSRRCRRTASRRRQDGAWLTRCRTRS